MKKCDISRLQLAFASLFATMTALQARGMAIVNDGKVRVDVKGRAMDVYDGVIVQFPGSPLFYWYGMGDTNCSERKGLRFDPSRRLPRHIRGVWRVQTTSTHIPRSGTMDVFE